MEGNTMTNEVMATILDHFHNGYPVEVSRDEAQALKAGAAALRALEWRPIDATAKNGDRHLLAAFERNVISGEIDQIGYPWVGMWHNSLNRWASVRQEMAADAFTHYMPIPAPPKEGV